MTIAPNIRQGIKFLDEHYPGWPDAIDLDSLDMQLTTQCMLGQLEGDFFAAKAKHRLFQETTIRLGFDVDSGYGSSVPLYRSLKRRWKAAIRRRRATS
jgi:hypothetical protein